MGAHLPTPAHCLLLLISKRLKNTDTKAALSKGWGLEGPGGAQRQKGRSGQTESCPNYLLMIQPCQVIGIISREAGIFL